MRQQFASSQLADLRWPDFSDYQTAVRTFYESIDYGLAWTRGGEPTSRAVALIQLLLESDTKGLDAEDYDAARWAARLASLRTARAPEDLGRFDLGLTVSLMRYVSDLRCGKWNPGLYRAGFDFQRERYELPNLIGRLMSSPDVRAAIASLEPPFRGYWQAQKALQSYLRVARDDDGELLPATKKPVEPGMDYAGIPRLVRLLHSLGDLPQNVSEAGRYSAPLVDAVKRFQVRHGLPADGRIGKATLVELNVPLRRRVRQLQFSLECWRWVPHEFPRPSIMVNIPEFQLHALNEDYATELEMKVVVGGAYGHQTPVFSADLKEVTFRPYWNVPWSITRAELVPKIKKDPMYLAKNDYEVVMPGDEAITRGEIDDSILESFRAGTLSLRQRPGPKNALGLVAFMFPNEYNVYMHDTPASRLFSQSRRDFSHGCIRVEQPSLLAQWVLRGLDEWTPEKIGAAMKGDKTIHVPLIKQIPVLVVYATAVALENGEVRFFDDIYGHDAELAALHAKGYPCVRWNPTNDGRARHLHE
jgi:murein L,D-transpeptidase YcbB/YkuD